MLECGRIECGHSYPEHWNGVGGGGGHCMVSGCTCREYIKRRGFSESSTPIQSAKVEVPKKKQ